MDHRLLSAFARCYRGRHEPADALYWLDHPDQAGPTGAPPVQAVLLAAEQELRRAGSVGAADLLLQVAMEMLSVDRDDALEALRVARTRLCGPPDISP